jgi:FMN phosphatase YigB (HAD superfamily)
VFRLEQNYIFSLCGTVLYYDPRTFLRTLWKDQARALRLYELVFHSPEWRMLEDGAISRSDAMEWLCRRSPAEAEHIRLVLKHWLRCLTPKWETVDLLTDMKESGKSIYFAAALNSDGKDYVLNTYPFISLFNGGVFSCEEGGPMADRLCGLYRLDPARTVFVSCEDEQRKAAEAAGFRAVLFTGAERLKDSLL